MPVITITVSGEQISPMQYQGLQPRTNQLTTESMDKHPSATAVPVQSLPSLKQEETEPKRLTDGSLDIEHYVKLGRLMRAKAYAGWWKRLWRSSRSSGS